jgi:MFS family permease
VLGDRIGPRRVLARIVIWWSAFTALTGAMRSFSPLVITRFLFGVGEAGAYPNSSAAIARWFPVVERARAQGVVWMFSRLGGALAPLIVIPIQQAYGWRASFYAFGALGLAWAVVWYRWFRDRPEEKAGVPQAELAELSPTDGASKRGELRWRTAFAQSNLWWIMLMYHANAWCGFFFLSLPSHRNS